jgi:hypothetical protein
MVQKKTKCVLATTPAVGLRPDSQLQTPWYVGLPADTLIVAVAENAAGHSVQAAGSEGASSASSLKPPPLVTTLGVPTTDTRLHF